MDNGNFDSSNSLVHLLDNDSKYTSTEEINYTDLIKHSYYCTNHEFLNMINVTNGVSILTLNCQSLSAKFDQLCLFLNSVDYKIDIICLQETWCKLSNQAQLFQIDNYNSIAVGCKASNHGGLITYIHEDFNYEQINVGEHSDIWESLFIEIHNNNTTKKKIIIGNIYRPPKTLNKHLTLFITEFSKILDKLQKKKAVSYLAGDYNINMILLKEKPLYNEFFDSLISAGFHPKITLPTRITNTSHTLIDNIFTNSKTLDEKSGIILYKISDHYAAFTITKPFKLKQNLKKTITIHINTSKAQEKFKKEVGSMNIYNQLNKEINSNINENYEIFEQCIVSSKEKHMYKKTIRFDKTKHKVNTWMTDQLLKEINHKNTLYKNFIQTPEHHDEYKQRELELSECQKMIRRNKDKAKRAYYFNLFNKFRTDIKNTWKQINTVLKVKAKETTIVLEVDNIKITDMQIIVDKFNSFFSNIGLNTSEVINNVENINNDYKQYLTNKTDKIFKFEEIREESIIHIINGLKNTNTTGHDLLSNKLLKLIKCEIAKPLTFIINQCLHTGYFPDKLKLARIRPLFKKGDKNAITNYRPISILPSVSKIFERVIHKQLSSYLENNNLLTKTQYGYRNRHSTEFASMELLDRIYSHMEQSHIPIAIFLDLSKAFDTLDHSILLDKLQFYGIHDTANMLLRSYLENRQQYVEINEVKSNISIMNIGVPQGSVLGPLLFNIYINDMCHVSKAFDIINYADDTTLISTIEKFRSIGTPNSNTGDKITTELRKINKWLTSQKLCLNVKKTKFMLFHMPQKQVPNINISINDVVIEKVDQFNFLGLTIDTHLKWKEHVQSLASKLSQLNGILKRLQNTFPQRILLLIYNSLFISHINYCLLLWGTNCDRIFKLQKKAIRTISFSNYISHTDPLFKALGLLKIQDIYDLNLLKLYYKLKHNATPSYFSNFITNVHESSNITPRYELRNKRDAIPIPYREYLKRNTRYQLLQLIHNFDRQLLGRAESDSMTSFVKHLKLHFINNYKQNCVLQSCYSCKYIKTKPRN